MANIGTATSNTLTDIANKALASIGKQTINDIDDVDDSNAKTVRRHIYDVIAECQTMTFWPELRTIVEDIPRESELSYEEFVQYKVPPGLSAIIRLRRKSSNGTWLASASWIRREELIVVSTQYAGSDDASYDTIDIEGIKYSIIPSEWSILLKKRIWTELAAVMAYELDDDNRYAAARNLADRTLIQVNAKQFTQGSSPVQVPQGHSLYRSRQSGRFGRGYDYGCNNRYGLG